MVEVKERSEKMQNSSLMQKDLNWRIRFLLSTLYKDEAKALEEDLGKIIRTVVRGEKRGVVVCGVVLYRSHNK